MSYLTLTSTFMIFQIFCVFEYFVYLKAQESPSRFGWSGPLNSQN